MNQIPWGHGRWVGARKADDGGRRPEKEGSGGLQRLTGLGLQSSGFDDA